MNRRAHAHIVGALAVSLALSGAASAHSELMTSSPKPGAVLRNAPRQVTLKFGRELDVRRSMFQLTGPTKPTIVGRVDLDDLDHASLTARIRRGLTPGTYLVRWRAVDAVDGDALTGSFRFRIKRS